MDKYLDEEFDVHVDVQENGYLCHIGGASRTNEKLDGFNKTLAEFLGRE